MSDAVASRRRFPHITGVRLVWIVCLGAVLYNLVPAVAHLLVWKYHTLAWQPVSGQVVRRDELCEPSYYVPGRLKTFHHYEPMECAKAAELMARFPKRDWSNADVFAVRVDFDYASATHQTEFASGTLGRPTHVGDELELLVKPGDPSAVDLKINALIFRGLTEATVWSVCWVVTGLVMAVSLM